MTKLLITIIVLAAILENLCALAQNNNNTLSFQEIDDSSSEPRSLALTWRGSGYIVSVKITNEDISAVNSDNIGTDDNSHMMLALYTSLTLLAGNCLSFTPIFTDEDENSLVNEISNLNYPYFTVKSGFNSPFQFGLFSTYSNYDLDAMIATSCSQQGPSSYGSDSFGLLGMGINNNALSNNQTPVIFSIYLNAPTGDGQLLFTTDFSHTVSHTPVSTLIADVNWHVLGVSSLKIGAFSYHTSSTNLIFDVNSYLIGLPLTIYKTVISALQSISSVSCPADTYSSPACTYSGHIVNLPDIVLGVGTEKILIPPAVYAVSGSANTITFNFRALSSNMSDINYITSSYSSYIILDSNFMSYYYTVFTAGSNTGTITLYAAIQTTDNTLTIVFIVLGFIVLLMFLVFRCGCQKKNKLKQEADVQKPIYPSFSDSPVHHFHKGSAGKNNSNNMDLEFPASQRSEQGSF